MAHFRPLGKADLDAACTGENLEASCYRTVRRLASDCAQEIDRRFPKILRRVGGYNLDEFVDPSKPFNLSKIMVGSEGTLGLVVAAKINLVPLPKAKAVLTIEFANLLDALAATPLILRHGPSAVEVMDRFILDHARESPALDRLRQSIFQSDPGALLCVEFYADRPDDLPPRLEALEKDLAGSGFDCRWRRALTMAEQARIWSLREASLGLSMAMKGDDKSLSFVEDTAVAPEKLRDYIDRFLQIVRGHGTVAGVYAHASVGCLHVRPVVNLKTAEGVQRFEAIANDIADLVLEFGGALSGEHGDGMVRGPFTAKMFGPTLYDAFRTLKKTFDPDGLFNPGKITDAPPLTGNLRFGAGYKTADPPTLFDFSEHGGMGRAVEMCSGLGVCRKKLDGTMCPSYMATREEKHSTRGRANTLRLAMAGRLGEAGLGDEDVYDVLDLCLECRACKAECPVGVDVARFKSEFLAELLRAARSAVARASYRPHPRAVEMGQPVRAPFKPCGGQRHGPMAGREASPRGSKADVSDLDATDVCSPVRAARHHTPAPNRGIRASTGTSPGVILFNDTFTNYNHPEVGIAAAEVFDAAGIGVRLAPHVCCGRPMISQGLLDAGAWRGPRKRGCPLRSRGERRPHRVSRTQLPLGRTRGCTGAPARRGAAQGTGRRRRVCVVRGSPGARVAGRAHPDRSAAWSVNGSPPRTLPSEGDGPRGVRPRLALAHPVVLCHRPRRRMLRDGRIVRLRARALRGLPHHRRAQASAGRTRRPGRHRPRRVRRVVPPAGRALHRRARRPSGGAPAVAHSGNLDALTKRKASQHATTAKARSMACLEAREVLSCY